MLYHSVNHTTLSFFCTKLWPAILSNYSSSGAWQWRWYIPTDRTSSTLPSPISVNCSAHYRVNGGTHCRRMRCDKRYSSSRQKVSTTLTSCPCLLIKRIEEIRLNLQIWGKHKAEWFFRKHLYPIDHCTCTIFPCTILNKKGYFITAQWDSEVVEEEVE